MKQLGMAVAAGVLAFIVTGWAFPEKIAILQGPVGDFVCTGSNACPPYKIVCWDGSALPVGDHFCPPKVVETGFNSGLGLVVGSFVFVAFGIALSRRKLSELGADIRSMNSSRTPPPDW